MRILIVEDEFKIADVIASRLRKENYIVDVFGNGEEGLDNALTNIYDLIILDVMLPKVDGFKILEEIRREKINAKVIMLTAKSMIEDKLTGFNNGANDYLTKPFQSAVLIARIEAHLRRHHKHFLDEIKFEDVMMNTKNREVTIDNHVIVLTKVEYDLLKMFMEHPKEAVSRETLLQSIWGFQYDGDTRIVDVHVFKLKGKLKESRVSFKSVRGVGYKLVKKDD